MFTKAIKSILFFSPVMVCTVSFGQIRQNNNDKDHSKIVSDSIKLDTIIPVKEKLEFVVEHSSEDEIHNRKKRMTYLLRKAHVVYGDMTIDADYIELNWDTGDVYAEGKRDSIGNIIEKTKFLQGQQEILQDAFKVNFKTKVGIAYNIRMTQEDGIIIADKAKRVNDSVMLLKRADFTTDTYFKEGKDTRPDYFLRAKEGKMVDKNGKKTLITGPINMWIYDVPTPLALPFGYIPAMGEKRAAGILMPRPGERTNLGFFIEDLGFYVPFGDNFDLKLSGDIYTKGSWAVKAESTYKKRYKYSGSFSAATDNRLTGIKGISNGANAFQKNNMFQVTWSHRQDPKANPYWLFNANVNFSSTKYYRESVRNQYINSGDVFTNNVNSSISLTKNFETLPFTASMNMNHSQNYNTGIISVTLPNLTFTMSRIYPFAKKNTPKEGLLQNLGVSYAFQAANQVTTNDSDIFTDKMWKDQMRMGASHKVDLNTGVTLANYFPLTLSSRYNEVWGDNHIIKSYNSTNNKEEKTIVKGFNAYRTFDFNASISTNFYGLYLNPNKEAKILGIQHVISPSIGFTYTPNFRSESWGYYKPFTNKNQEQDWYNQYENILNGVGIPPLSNSLNFGISNNLEMKIKDNSDPKGFKKIKIFETLNFSSSYNLAAEEFKLSPIIINGMTSLFDRKVNIQFSSSVNPYQIRRYLNASGEEVSEYVDKIGLGNLRITNMTLGTGYTFDNSTFGGKRFDAKNYKKRGTVRDENFYYDNDNYAQFAIPWSLTANVTYNYNKMLERKGKSTGSIAFNGKISPTPYWAISANATYDFIKNEITYVRFGFERDLRSFTLSFNWTPMGTYKSYDFFIGIKASILQDLKYNDRSRLNY
ncbi:putative LPS assembly protein LptD [Empedobacter tilapiae]|uniref:putative LPS assembly protein LptD n=1 Tax=Empedobacter tilapiae TaxID=2491114 RepID=UPI0028D388FE|nr:putative LPS assembly protein LptD [Empedobacter tilapiae]